MAARPTTKKRKETKSPRQAYNGKGKPVPPPAPRLFKGDDHALRVQLARKRKEIKAAATAYSNAGSKVNSLKQDLETLLEEAESRTNLEDEHQPGLRITE